MLVRVAEVMAASPAPKKRKRAKGREEEEYHPSRSAKKFKPQQRKVKERTARIPPKRKTPTDNKDKKVCAAKKKRVEVPSESSVMQGK